MKKYGTNFVKYLAKRQEEAAEAAAKKEEDRKKELMLAMSMNFGYFDSGHTKNPGY